MNLIHFTSLLKFYDGFAKFDIFRVGTKFYTKMTVCIVNIHAGTISEVNGIVIDNENQISKAIKEFITLMYTNCTITCDRGISYTR